MEGAGRRAREEGAIRNSIQSDLSCSFDRGGLLKGGGRVGEPYIGISNFGRSALDCIYAEFMSELLEA